MAEVKDSFIKEVLSSLNKNFKKQEASLDRLTGQYERAVQNNDGEKYIEFLSEQMDKMNSQIERQTAYSEKFYEKMTKFAGRPDLDKDMLTAVMKFREDFILEQRQMNKWEQARLKEEELQVTDSEKADVHANEAYELQYKQLELQEKRNAVIEAFKKKFGETSYAIKAIEHFMQDADEQKEVSDELDARGRDTGPDQSELARQRKAAAEGEERWNKFVGNLKKTWEVIKNNVKEVIDTWDKFNTQGISDAKELGMTSLGSARVYTRDLMQQSKELSRNFGLTIDQAKEMESAFSNATGKAALLNQSQLEDIVSIESLIGKETTESALQTLDQMGVTSDVATELLDKTYARAANNGLNVKKTSEAFVKNMSLANKLTFRNGLDGISKMTMLSERIKLNLESLPSVAEKFSTIEGAIQGSAQLQMLGGAGALYGGNPMQMLFEATSDPEALFKRIGKMAADQAVFNRKTGESELSPWQMALMREQAKVLGMNPEELVQSAKAQSKNKELDFQWRRGNPQTFNEATEEQRAAIENKAIYNKDTQQFEVTYYDQAGEKQTVGVNQLTPEAMEDIMKDNISAEEDIKNNVRRIATEMIGAKQTRDAMKDQLATGYAQASNGLQETADNGFKSFNRSWLWGKMTDGGIGSIATFASNILLGAVGRWALKKLVSRTPLYQRVKGWVKGKVTGQGTPEGTVPKGTPEGTVPKGTPEGTVPKGTPEAPGGSALKTGGKLASSEGEVVGEEAANAARAVKGGGGAEGEALANVGKVSKWGKGLKVGGVALSVAAGLYEGYSGWQDANKEHEDRVQMTQVLRENNRITEREKNGRDTWAKHERQVARGEAVGKGVGTAVGGVVGIAAGAAAGAATGAALGSVVPGIGTAVGLIVGGAVGVIGGMIGKKVGHNIASQAVDKDESDTIGKELDKINEDDEDDNIRRIVLPIESIDYNVSLIAERFGIASAMPARNNIYLQAEAAGDLEAPQIQQQEGQMVDTVNPVEEHTTPRVSEYVGPKSITLNINGSIELTGGGGRLSADDIKYLIEHNPSLQRQIADVVTGRQNKNGNVGRSNMENNNNRRGKTQGSSSGGDEFVSNY